MRPSGTTSQLRAPTPRWRGPSLHLGAMAGLSGVLTWNLLRDGITLSLDSSSQYWPWYVYLGQSVRGGRIPAWNPSTFGGMPFAADPLSGWTYLPAMSIFAVLPPAAGIATFMFAHFFLASLATAALGRTLGLVWPAALLSGAVYASSGAFQFQSISAQPFAAVAAWLPVCLLGTERALWTARSETRWAWWSLAGLALCQIVATWPGQGTYYVLLIFASWTTARALAAPTRLSERLKRAALHLGVPIVIGFLLAAAGILPRLELQSLSNLANGYAVEDQVGGWQLADFARLATPGPWYVGIITLGLALAGLVALARGPRCLKPVQLSRVRPLFAGGGSLFGRTPRAAFGILAAQWVAVLVLAGSVRAPLHATLAAILPGFASVHSHIPERILVVGYLAPALLAGLGFAVVGTMVSRRWLAGLVAAAACLDLLFSGRLAVDRQVGATWDPLRRVTNFDASLAPSAAASFLLVQPPPFRFLGYGGDGPPYTQQFADSRTLALLVNNRALSLGLQDVQGYDAVHLARFDAYLTAVNGGRTQNYHDGQIFEPGLRSPLLDLLGVRFMVLPRDSPQTDYPVVFEDAWTRVVERPGALPRGWLVHAARLASQDEALRLIGSGAIDPRDTALIEQDPTNSAALASAVQVSPVSIGDGSTDHISRVPGGNGPLDQVSLVWDRPEAARWQVASDGPGILVTSEVAYPAWAAYIDGERAPILTADGLLRAVAVPAGRHVVDVRYESATLSAGLAISLVSLLAVGAILARASLLARR
ncbi:MAG: hypothetical protein M3069_24635 [Chloroflexota bacterium]|nr:hypothetical protein [Chloroflexota bacterium]